MRRGIVPGSPVRAQTHNAGRGGKLKKGDRRPERTETGDGRKGDRRRIGMETWAWIQYGPVKKREKGRKKGSAQIGSE
jgi:hypothetical protein